MPRLESVSSVRVVARCHKCELGVDETVAAIASAADEKGFAEPTFFIATPGDGARGSSSSICVKGRVFLGLLRAFSVFRPATLWYDLNTNRKL